MDDILIFFVQLRMHMDQRQNFCPMYPTSPNHRVVKSENLGEKTKSIHRPGTNYWMLTKSMMVNGNL